MQDRKAPAFGARNWGKAKSSNQVIRQEVSRELAHDGLVIALIRCPAWEFEWQL
jgi:hypothetical protein